MPCCLQNLSYFSGLKSRKHIIDGLEDKVTDLQEKIANFCTWNFNHLATLEAKEHNLEDCLMQVTTKNDEMKTKAKEKAEQIKNVKGQSQILSRNQATSLSKYSVRW